MANPPPNNPLLPLVTTGAIVPTFVVSEVEVFSPPQQDINAPQTSITLTSHFEESVKQTTSIVTGKQEVRVGYWEED